jgi:hypothetical protein
MTTSGQNDDKVVVMIPTGVLKNRFGVAGSFTVGVLLFFLPFINVKCNDVKLASATGIQLSAGFEFQPGKDWENFGRMFGTEAEKKKPADDLRSEDLSRSTTSASKPGNIHSLGPNYFLAAALTAGVFGLIFSLIPFKKRWLCCLIAGWTGITGFIISVFAIFDKTSEYRVDAGFIKLSVNFTFWFFLSLIAFIAAVVLSHRQWTETRVLENEKEINEFILSSGYEQPISNE